MNKTIIGLATFIQPGQPLVVVGDYGSSELHCVTQAIKSTNRQVSSWLDLKELHIQEQHQQELGGYSVVSLLPNLLQEDLTRDGVLVVEEANYLANHPEWLFMFLQRILFSDRCSVFLMRSLEDSFESNMYPLLDRCRVVRMLTMPKTMDASLFQMVKD